MKKISIFLSVLLAIFITGCSTSDLSPSFNKNVKKEYFTGGEIRSEFIMENGSTKNGILKKYGYDGKLTSTAHIKNGVRDGVETWYDKQGRILMTVPYFNGRKNGIQKAYYANGDVWRAYTYRYGVLHGVATEYNKDGSVRKKVTFNNGKLIN